MTSLPNKSDINVTCTIVSVILWNFFDKGQIKPKADWRAIDSPKKQTNANDFFFFCHDSPEILKT